MPAPIFTKAKPLSMKAHPEFNEKWLQSAIVEDPTLLGLGDLTVKDVERRQRTGRLDLLLTDPEAATRYEVEIQLGATDEAHIIRTIEYWDIEKARYPMYDHVAVIVAEDVTSRFLNVVSLLNRAVPLIAIQLNAWEVGGVTTLIATKVMDLLPVSPDDEDDAPGQAADRKYWADRSNPASLKLADDILALVHEATGDTALALKYNKHYIGLARDGVPDNFITVTPRKSAEHVMTELRVPRSDELTARIEEEGLDLLRYDTNFHSYVVRLTHEDLTKSRAILTDILQRCSGLKPTAADIATGTA